jgi:hypothetical protein
MFAGMHGMRDIDVFEGTVNEAMEYARELSEEIIESFSVIYNDLEDAILEECEKEGVERNSEEGQQIAEELYEDDLDYGFVELDRSKLPTDNLDELSRMFDEDGEFFLNAYRV